MYEYVYAIVPLDYPHFKIGRWSGKIAALRSRYQTYIVGKFEMVVFQSSAGASPRDEKTAHQACEAFHIKGEWFNIEALAKFFDVASANALDSCYSIDLDTRNHRLERKRFAEIAQENKRLMTIAETTNPDIAQLKSDLQALREVVAEQGATISFLTKQNRIRYQDSLAARTERVKETVDSRGLFLSWFDENFREKAASHIHLHRIVDSFNNQGMLDSTGQKLRYTAHKVKNVLLGKQANLEIVPNKRDPNCDCNNPTTCLQDYEFTS